MVKAEHSKKMPKAMQFAPISVKKKRLATASAKITVTARSAIPAALGGTTLSSRQRAILPPSSG